MLLTALTPPLLPQGARAAAEAQAQPLAPHRELPAPRRQLATVAARASMKPARAPIKAVKQPKVRMRSHQRA